MKTLLINTFFISFYMCNWHATGLGLFYKKQTNRRSYNIYALLTKEGFIIRYNNYIHMILPTSYMSARPVFCFLTHFSTLSNTHLKSFIVIHLLLLIIVVCVCYND